MLETWKTFISSFVEVLSTFLEHFSRDFVCSGHNSQSVADAIVIIEHLLLLLESGFSGY